MEVFWMLVVFAVLGWAIFVQVEARRHAVVEVAMSEQAAAEVVAACFNITWNRISGEGDLNFQPKLRVRAPVVSVAFTPDGASRCGVEIWTSRFTTRYGMMHHAQLVWRKKRKITAELAKSLNTAAG
ncbi:MULTISPECIES: hypothetical protein [unclassified Amycolatopsis]|uniref:hypothetical protein n=1 Tax=unclassified Amycolatopsis TaxID=2618356 RepID=UPI002876DD5F|nr:MULTISPECIES: hypothetical protein [unclassified Amycolatopsis]MDS0133212.1 hypothetical protein [Amycolatopsis sp. 505]MDS0146442.1 hypothetical protein [Amycolatopsis sp. CM201R]